MGLVSPTQVLVSPAVVPLPKLLGSNKSPGKRLTRRTFVEQLVLAPIAAAGAVGQYIPLLDQLGQMLSEAKITDAKRFTELPLFETNLHAMPVLFLSAACNIRIELLEQVTGFGQQ